MSTDNPLGYPFKGTRKDGPAKRRARKAWNGGSRERAMDLARERTEAAIASGCPRCLICHGTGGGENPLWICGDCGGAGFLVPIGGMPIPGSAR